MLNTSGNYGKNEENRFWTLSILHLTERIWLCACGTLPKFLAQLETSDILKPLDDMGIKKNRYSFGISQNRYICTAFLQFNHEFGQKVEIWQNTENGIAKGQPSAT